MQGFGILANPSSVSGFLRAAPSSNVLRCQRPSSKSNSSGELTTLFHGAKEPQIPAFWGRPIAFRVPDVSAAIHTFSGRTTGFEDPETLLGPMEFLVLRGLDKWQL